MAKQQILIVVLVASIIHLAYAAPTPPVGNLTAADATVTAYDILGRNNLPRGLLSVGVKSYNLNPDGKLEVTLSGECEFPISLGGQQFKFHFASIVGGVIQTGSIREVYGVSIQVKFGCLGISQVDRAGEQLTIQAQQFKQPFPVRAFKVSPSCS